MKFKCAYDKEVKLHKLTPHPKNPNKHPDRQIELLAKIIDYQGQRSPIVVSNLSGFIVKGHGRLDALKRLGWDSAAVDYQDYKNEAQEYADLVADNKIAELANHDDNLMIEGIKELGIDDLELLGLDDFDLPIDPVEAHADEDEVPDNVDTRCKLGDVWTLGEHRLLCGDATDVLCVEKLMGGEKADMVYTDPPYGISLNADYKSYKPKGSNPDEFSRPVNSFKNIKNDDKGFDASFMCCFFNDVKEIFIFGANNFCHTIPDYFNGSWVCWDRTGNSENLNNILGSSFELCWSKNRHKYEIARITWKGVLGHSKKDDGEKKVHPSMKPVKLHEWFFDKWGKYKNKIVDLYGGSGSTLIACEKTHRKCYMMELDPHYCDVILARWEKYTGKEARLDASEEEN